jgi:Fic family protein
MKPPPAGRSGRYVRQLTGYKAFIPNRLPPEPPVLIDDETWDLVSKADRGLARLDMTADILPDPDLFVYMYVRKEALLSSQIEGTQASLIDVLQFEVKAKRQARNRDVFEVVNYVKALRNGLRLLDTLPVSLRLIRKIHESLMTDVRGQERDPGEFRRSQNWIGPEGCDLDSANFIPPPPHEMLIALSDLEIFMHDLKPMPFLIKVGLIHAQFETIHPFLDGNGRIGRLLITLLMCERKILNQPLLYLSFYFKKHRAEYYDRLQYVRDRGDWEGWLKFFLRGVFEVSQEATEIARQIVKLREQHRDLIISELGKGARTGLVLLESLFRTPYVTVQSISRDTDLSRPSANVLVNRFCRLNILEEYTGKRRNRQFGYTSYLKLFEEPEERLETRKRKRPRSPSKS